MHVAIRNLVPGYLEFAREARRRRPQELRAVWERLYVSRHPDVFEAYFQAGEPPDFEATIEQVLAESDRFAGRAELLARVARDKAPRVAALFEAELCELPYVTMVGLHRFDGWMQDLDGSPRSSSPSRSSVSRPGSSRTSSMRRRIWCTQASSRSRGTTR